MYTQVVAEIMASSPIQKRRKALKLNQADVVNALAQAGHPMSLSAYQRHETLATRERFADPDFVKVYARILRWPVEDLLMALGFIEPRTARHDPALCVYWS